MGDWLGYLRLRAKAKTGVNSNVVIGGVVIVWAALGTLLWLSITLFLWIAKKYDDPIVAGLVLTAIYFCIAVIAAVAMMIARHSAKQRAEAALAARNSVLFDPSLLTVGMEVGRAIGWRRLVSLAGVAILAAGLAREWTAREEKPPEGD